MVGAILRVWGTAYLGSGVMRDSAMQGEQFVAAGPYRYVRNPLYLGSWLLALGVSILMPPSGAAFFLLAFSVFVLLLISAEERFLAAKQGDVYQQYRRRVPRLLPRMAAGNIAPSARPQWWQAFLAETYPIAITLCFAGFRLALQRAHPDPMRAHLLRAFSRGSRMDKAADRKRDCGLGIGRRFRSRAVDSGIS